jgi:hypothetical protein
MDRSAARWYSGEPWPSDRGRTRRRARVRPASAVLSDGEAAGERVLSDGEAASVVRTGGG